MTTIVLQIYNWIKIIFLQLWLSVTSVNFYQRILLFYGGYGIKYILTLSFVSSMLCGMFILRYMDDVKQYLLYGVMSSTVTNLDHIVSQLPELSYDGSQISLDGGDPIYINNNDNLPVAIIDPDNKIVSAVRAKIPILFTSKKLIISFVDSQKTNVTSIPIEYWQIFGKEPKVLTQELQKESLGELFDRAPKALIYLAFPLFGLLIFFNLFLEKSVLIIIILVVCIKRNYRSTSIPSTFEISILTPSSFICICISSR